MPGLDKYIEDATTDSLAFHGNLFGQFNLDGAGTSCVDDIEGTTPYLGLAAATTDGAADIASARDEHFCPHFTRNRPFAPDNSCHSDGLSAFQFMYQFLKKFSHDSPAWTVLNMLRRCLDDELKSISYRLSVFLTQ